MEAQEDPGKGFIGGNNSGVQLKLTKETIDPLFCSRTKPQLEQYQTFTQNTTNNHCTFLFYNMLSPFNLKTTQEEINTPG